MDEFVQDATGIVLGRLPKLGVDANRIVTVLPEVQVLGPMELTPDEQELLRRWIDLNRNVIIDHWTYKIKWSSEAMGAIKPI